MLRKLSFNFSLACALVLASTILISCGKPIQAAKVGASGYPTGPGGGGGYPPGPTPTPFPTPTPSPNPNPSPSPNPNPTPPPVTGNGVSCSVLAGTPTFTEVPLKITVLGNVNAITLEGQPVALPAPGYTEVNIKYPVTTAGPKTVTVLVQNTVAGTAFTCTASFEVPDVVDARKTAIPNDGDDYYIYRTQTLISDPDQTSSRYLFAVSKFTGQAYYNSISLDPKYKPGRLDIWKGWQALPGQGTYVGLIISIIPYSTNSVVISVGALGVGYFATTATCKAGSCSFSGWSEY